MKRLDGLVTLIRRVGDATGTTEGDAAIRSFTVQVIEARDTRTAAEIAAEIQALADKADAVHPGGGPVLVSLDSVE